MAKPNRSTRKSIRDVEKKLRKWVITIPALWVGDRRVQIRGTGPSWHAMIHCVGYVGIARAVLSLLGVPGVLACTTVYVTCVVLAALTTRLVRKMPDETMPRVYSASLGALGMIAAVVMGYVTPAIPASLELDVIVPLGTLTVMGVFHVTGEVLVRRFPADVMA